MTGTDAEQYSENLTGIVDDIVYQNEENGYSVVELETEQGEPVTVIGTMPYITVGERITVRGEWTTHPSYGRQFKAVTYDRELPTDEEDVLRYLSSGAVKGIGAKTAKRIVERFGTETFDVIENHSEWLTEISGITETRAKKIGEDFREKAGARSTLMFCRDFFTAETSMRIYKKWGGGAVDIIRRNPYRLCREFGGIGFRRADNIAASMGINSDDPNRLKSGIEYILNANAQQNGHTCCPRDELINQSAALLCVGTELIAETVASMLISGRLVKFSNQFGECIFSDFYFNAEKYIADKLKSLDSRCPRFNSTDIERYIIQTEKQQGITYADLQRRAIYEALANGVFVLTGGPGTGKTTVIKALLAIFNDMGFAIALAAPTGRAAKRMSEATGDEAKTVHRLLEMEYSNERFPTFMRDENNLLDENVVIIDEASMMDSQLTASLLKAIKPGSRLIIIGDADQLPSVGAGNVLGDIIASGVINTVCLTEIFRQSAESSIIVNAHAVNRGEHPDVTAKSTDFFFLQRSTDRDAARTIAELCKTRLPKAYGAEKAAQAQVITPSRRGESGTEKLNLRMQDELNPPSPDKKEIKRRDRLFREGDRVMQIKNNYSLEWEKADGSGGVGVFNGDIGVIETIDTESECFVIRFDDRVVSYDFSLAEELEHAYAITVHKSQGSEYPIVIIPFYNCPPMLMTRNLLYTAITRAKTMVIAVGNPQIMYRMIDNNAHTERATGLKYLLQLP